MGANDCLYEISSELNDNWFKLSESDQKNEIELLGCYLRTYDSVFNL